VKPKASPTTGRARDLRRRQTDAERLLWSRLRDRRPSGAKFRRQHPIGRYVADFVCPERGLVIELDGSQHLAGAEQDRRRTEQLARHGYRVVRFWDNEVLLRTDSVVAAILDALESPSPPPSPVQGRGKTEKPRG